MIFFVNAKPDFGSGAFVWALRFIPKMLNINKMINGVVLLFFIIQVQILKINTANLRNF